MTDSVVIWKEYREHRTVWLALACLSVAVLLGVGYSLGVTNPSYDGWRDGPCIVAAVLAWTYGVVCGAMLLAGEAEAGTQSWLDTLPVGRKRVWRSKGLAGLLFVVLQTVVVFGVSAFVNLVPEWPGPAGWFALLLLCALTGLGWGMFLSSFTKSALAAVALAILVQTLAVPAAVLGAAFLIDVASTSLGVPVGARGEGFVLAGFLTCAIPFFLSQLVYARDDRRRNAVASPRPNSTAGGWIEPLHLAWMQSRGLALGVVVGSLLLGFLVPMNFPILWPLLSLLLGVACGATAYLDEQGGAYRFLGDQRFPLNRLWVAKLAIRSSLALLGWGVMLLPGTLYVASQQVRTGAFAQQAAFAQAVPTVTGSPLAFLAVWVCYGFASGHLCALLFRKALVAIVVASGLAALLSCVWIPSIILGGVSAWQVLSVPAVLVAGSRLLLWPWATDQLASWLTGRRMGAVALACVALTALGVRMRVAEIPDAEVPNGYRAYLDSLPDENHEASRIGQDACKRLANMRSHWYEPPKKQLFAEEKHIASTYPRQVELVCEHGWPGEAGELGAWMDRTFEDPVWAEFAKLRGLTTGMLDDPRKLKPLTPLSAVVVQEAVLLLIARGLQKQKHGKPEAFVENAETALALLRNLANHNRFGPYSRIEGRVLRGIRLWLHGSGNDPKLLRRLLAALQQHRRTLDVPADDPIYFDYRVAERGLENVSEWLRIRLIPWYAPASDFETAVLETASQVPWERSRLERQMRYLYWGISRQNVGMAPVEIPAWAHHDWVRDWGAQLSAPRKSPDRRHVCRFDGETLVVALRLYQAEKGKPAASLDALVPDYLPAVPNDPFSGKPFRYRLSKGESIEWPDDLKEPEAGEPGAGGPPAGMGAPQPVIPGLPPQAGMPGGPAPVAVKWPTRKVEAGQGIVWSVGEDGQDDGGKRQARSQGHQEPGEDMIFIVPAVKKPVERKRPKD